MSSVHFLVQPKELDELNAKLDRVIMYLERWDKRCHETNMLTLPVRTTQTKPRMARDSLMEPPHSDAVPATTPPGQAKATSVEKKARKPTTMAEALKSSDEYLEGSAELTKPSPAVKRPSSLSETTSNGSVLRIPTSALTKKSVKKVDEPTRKAIDIPGFASAPRTSKKKAKTSKPDKKTTRKRVAASSESNDADQEELLVSLAPPPTSNTMTPAREAGMDTRHAFSQKSDDEPDADDEEEPEDDDDDFVVEKQE